MATNWIKIDRGYSPHAKCKGNKVVRYRIDEDAASTELNNCPHTTRVQSRDCTPFCIHGCPVSLKWSWTCLAGTTSMIDDSNATVAVGTRGLDASNIEAWPCRPRRSFTTYDTDCNLSHKWDYLERGAHSVVHASGCRQTSRCCANGLVPVAAGRSNPTPSLWQANQDSS